MKDNTRISANRYCPHYKRESSQVIYCDGIQPGSVVHLAFSNRTEALNYKRNFCGGDYDSCRLCKMLEDTR